VYHFTQNYIIATAALGTSYILMTSIGRNNNGYIIPESLITINIVNGEEREYKIDSIGVNVVYDKYNDSYIFSGGKNSKMYELSMKNNVPQIIAESDTLCSGSIVVDSKGQIWITAKANLGVYFLGTDLSQKKLITFKESMTIPSGWFTVLNDTIYTYDEKNILIFDADGNLLQKFEYWNNTIKFFPTSCENDGKSVWFGDPSYYGDGASAALMRVFDGKYCGIYAGFPETRNLWVNEGISNDGEGNIWVNNPEQGTVTKVTPLYK
jgi:hypothetical protein